jgi:hypothetical protein
MVNHGGANGHYNGTREPSIILCKSPMSISFSGPPDDDLSAALHSYARKSLPLAQRLGYLLKDFSYKIKCVPTYYYMSSF